MISHLPLDLKKIVLMKNTDSVSLKRVFSQW